MADLQDWLKYVIVTTYADDTSTSISHKLISEVKRMLEEDAINVLKFMASNGLVANPTKTALLFLNLNKSEKCETQFLKIGDVTVNQVPTAKLLGVMINDDQSWNEQILGTGGMISSLNSRLFTIKRISAAISRDRLNRIVDSLFTSKLRYSLQLLGKVRTKAEDSTNGLLAKLQVTQNRMARFLNGTNLLDKVSNIDIFKNNHILSVNQLNCQIKLTEVWKAMNDMNYPIKWDVKPPPAEDARATRSTNVITLLESRNSSIEEATFIIDAAKVWNLAPQSLKDCKSLFSVKREIKKFAVSLPL